MISNRPIKLPLGLTFLLRRAVKLGLQWMPARKVKAPQSIQSIAYLFAGTYGDFVQCLPALQILAQTFPKVEIQLYGAANFHSSFSTELPVTVKSKKYFSVEIYFFKPYDLLLTNALGAYRVHFSFIARFCAQLSLGFRYAEEKSAMPYTYTLPLYPSLHSFVQINLELLQGLVYYGWPLESSVPKREATKKNSQSVVIHIGSAGLKKSFGLKLYAKILTELIQILTTNKTTLEIIYGQGDDDIVEELQKKIFYEASSVTLSWKKRNLPELIAWTRDYPGQIFCMNSFYAHLCFYLNKSATVIHREAIPFGYDCAPLHRQIILKAAEQWKIPELISSIFAV